MGIYTDEVATEWVYTQMRSRLQEYTATAGIHLNRLNGYIHMTYPLMRVVRKLVKIVRAAASPGTHLIGETRKG
jgi:hypothetical protein